MELDERVGLVSRNTAEILTPEELRGLFERTDHPRAYIGFEPSGQLTAGQLITARKMIDLQRAGCRLTVFLADWHAWINDKLGGDLDRIRRCGEYMRRTFLALGLDEDATEFHWTSELTGRSEYWSRVVRVAQATSLARAKRAMTILGRSEDEAELNLAKLFYPPMQVADIFELSVDLAYAGLDQRRAHVLTREVAHRYHWPVPVAVHTPLLSGLKGQGRMDPAAPSSENKMSKSDPSGAILLPSTPEEVEARIAGAFCPPKQTEGNPVVEIARFIVLPWEGRLEIPRAAEHGGPVAFGSEVEFLKSWESGALHPKDLKSAIAAALDRRIEPVREYFAHHPSESHGPF